MIQVHVPFTGGLRPCECSRQPHHYECRGPSSHFLECPPCMLRTEKFPTFQEAVAAWEDNVVESFRVRKSA